MNNPPKSGILDAQMRETWVSTDGVRYLPTESDVVALLHQLLEHELPEDRKLFVLEAGGGSETKIRLGRSTHIVAIDINASQLQRNTYADETVVGNIEAGESLGRSFDLIVCWDVLEHLRNPRAALITMIDHLGDGGLLLLVCPNPYSLKGWITKLTPHRLHVWYYKTVCGHVRAGEDGYAPFVTHLHRHMSIQSIKRSAEQADLEILLLTRFRGSAFDSLERKSPFGYAIFQALAIVMRLVSLDLVDPYSSDFAMVIRRPRV